MPALYKRPDSKWFWTAWRDEAGKLHRVSTKCTKRKEAEKAARTLYEAFRRRKIAAHVSELARAFHREVTGEALPETSLRRYAETWLAAKRGEVAKGTAAFYAEAVKRLLEHLGPKADGDMNFITKVDLTRFRDALRAAGSPATARHYFKAVRMVFRAARLDGVVASDPAEAVKLGREAEPEGRARRPFTVEEIRALLRACDGEWRGLVLFGLHTGQRLGDLARLTWANVDLEAGTLALVTRKTRHPLVLPLSLDMREALAAMPAAEGDPTRAPLFPAAWATLERTRGKVSTLSQQFTNILASLGLREPVSHRTTGQGRQAPRRTAALSFHSLRHSAVSMMKAAGVPDATVMALVGHESAAMSRHYTHVGRDALDAAVAALPRLLVAKESTTPPPA